jgi:CO/xanthine dehydrogenase Mo-binding subunit
MVVADTQTQANDAVELIDASFEPLPAVTDVYTAMADGLPQAVVSAVCDGLGIQHVDMPVTPLKNLNILHQN